MEEVVDKPVHAEELLEATMNLTWSSVFDELLITHRLSMAVAAIWAVARWVRGARMGQGSFRQAQWWVISLLLWALETVQQSWLLWESSVWQPASVVAFFALINGANVLGLLVVLPLVALGVTAAPRPRIQPLTVVGVLAAVASAFFVRVLLLWAGTIGLAAQIEGVP
jgi:hypothetical protein